MELNFNNTDVAKARFAFSTSDLVTVEGTAWRPYSFNEMGWLMELADGSRLSREFTHDHLRRLAAMGRLRHDPNFYDPVQAARRLKSTTP
jgi:hypothetical protein